MKVDLDTGKYIIAVSGGVDSMVLLHLLITIYHIPSAMHHFVVAHFDHGIRKASAKDRALVEETTKEHGLVFVHKEGNLGKDASESMARNARYDFLRETLRIHKADAIITAHHRDDAVETLIINIIRGTGRRGVLKETAEIKRPLLNVPKTDIVEYAKENNLRWREDESNQETRYLRNYVRQVLLPKMKQRDPEVTDKLLNSDASLKSLNTEIDSNIADLMEEKCDLSEKRVVIPRHWLIMTPNPVGIEIIHEAVRYLEKQSGVDRKNLKKLLVFAKTAKVHKKTPINSRMNMRTEPAKIVLELV